MRYRKKVIIHTLLVCIFVIIGIFMVKNKDFINANNTVNETSIEVKNNVNNVVDTANQNLNDDKTSNMETSYLNSIEDLDLYDVDGMSKNYNFKYNNEIYTAVYTTDNWHINDSYKITSEQDIIIICEALIDQHKIHGKDMISYRTAEDMTYEWLQHNAAYRLLPEESAWKNNAKDVDLDPADQGRSLIEMYTARSSKN